jgi:hypothetical protein
MYGKRAVFTRKVDVCYSAGAHFCTPKGQIVESPSAEIKLLHYKWLGYDYCMSKLRHRAKNLSPENIACGWSYQEHELTDEVWKGKWNKWCQNKTKVIP